MVTCIDQNTLNSLAALGADTTTFAQRKLPFYENAKSLVVADTSQSGIEHLLHPTAAREWQRLKQAARDDDIVLIIISAYRSFERQHELIEARVNAGEQVDVVLARLAPPGCSQHHTGRAIDIGTLGCEPAVEEFEHTHAFKWLHKNASRFGFTLSYPRDNKEGFDYEPWHWYFQDESDIQSTRS